MTDIDRVAEAICGETSAGKLFPWAESSEENREPWRRMARAAIAALHPVIETVEQLDALPVNALVEHGGKVFRNRDFCRWWQEVTGGRYDHDAPDILPARLIFVPERA
ncbi:hypothetical protein A5717_26145 [Mycolicibacterium porcinum]|uniref:hypothetical protein n=1 Tax=Mycolicibacterium porcinum TaxID=39693 RepID=UPI00080BED2E|nr:hypothetical protein [Mycolicibacterium porcinum]OCB09259.1 hypothetical protein A5717_26145 [Mycolicibacterium porcinum]